jgi:AraC-like DNA-binding protein
MLHRHTSSTQIELLRELQSGGESAYPLKENVGRESPYTHTLLCSTDARIKRVVALIEERFDRKLSLADMAQVAGLSTSRLRHKFKSEVGVTPAAYLRARRLCAARELLTGGQLTVKEAKAAVGISSDSYFTHQFKRTFGTPPSRSRPLEPLPGAAVQASSHIEQVRVT